MEEPFKEAEAVKLKLKKVLKKWEKSFGVENGRTPNKVSNNEWRNVVATGSFANLASLAS